MKHSSNASGLAARACFNHFQGQ